MVNKTNNYSQNLLKCEIKAIECVSISCVDLYQKRRQRYRTSYFARFIFLLYGKIMKDISKAPKKLH
jgi:hypothetical protein